MCLYYSPKHNFVSRHFKLEVTYNDLINNIVCNPSNHEYMMHRCTNCPGTNTLHKFLEEEVSDIVPDFQFHYSQWQTTGRASVVTVTSTCEEHKDTLISAMIAIIKHSFLAKCQANFLRSKKESLKANEVIVLGDITENYQFLVLDEILSYHWSKEYCTLHPLVIYFIDGDGNIQHNSLCFISDDNNHATNFYYKIRKSLLIALKKTFQLWIRSSISLAAVLNNIRITKTLLICVIISNISLWMLNRYSLQLVMASHHVMVLEDLLNVMLQKVVYKDPFMTKF